MRDKLGVKCDKLDNLGNMFSEMLKNKENACVEKLNILELHDIQVQKLKYEGLKHRQNRNIVENEGVDVMQKRNIGKMA